VNNRDKNIEQIEKYVLMLLMYGFKCIRYCFRICYKILRLFIRLIKRAIFITLKKMEPTVEKLTEKIYNLACKTFDLN